MNGIIKYVLLSFPVVLSCLIKDKILLIIPLGTSKLLESFSESLYQAIWLLVSSNITGKKYKFQYILSFIVIIFIASYGFFVRRNTLLSVNKTLHLMYLPSDSR